MRQRTRYILMIPVALAMGGVAYWHRPDADAQRADPVSIVRESPLDVRETTPPPPTPTPKNKIPATPWRPKEASIQRAPAPTDPPKEPPRVASYWHRAAERFNQQERLLNAEDRPAERANLIQSMARNVRIDTLHTLDWAMDLNDPTEQRAALEAINQNALVGIGARLQMDETGLPTIVETTILSALKSTGMSQAGDAIAGMVKADGSVVSFKNRPIREIVSLLHGPAGSEIQLLMERAPSEGQTEPYSFDVPVVRSMIIIQPPE